MKRIEQKIKKELAKYGLKPDAFHCPSCGRYTLLYCLREQDSPLIGTPYETYIDDDRSYICLNNDIGCFYGLINDF